MASEKSNMAAKHPQQEIKVVEFYSGIGGMHCALKACGIQVRVVAAIDINTTANQVYSHNFPDTKLLNRNIEGIKLDYFVKLDADAFLMSPPCQPFTRQGNQKASSDARTKSFLHIMTILKRLPKAPSYILMENVKGFETSDTREEFIKTLEETNYVFQEFLLTPTQFGIPNSRLRYFLIAVQKPMKLIFDATKTITLSWPVIPNLDDDGKSCSTLKIDNPRECCMICPKLKKQEIIQLTPKEPQESATQVLTTKDTESKCCNGRRHRPENVLEDEIKKYHQTVRNINYFLELDKDNNHKEFLLSETILKSKLKSHSPVKVASLCTRSDVSSQDIPHSTVIKRAKLIIWRNSFVDIVQEGCNHSCCFTKGYGHYVEGTGSVLQMKSIDTTQIFCQYKDASEEERLQLLAPLGLRYFTPREILNIHYFPKDFDFPQIISTKQKYRLIGNSLNVLMLSELMKLIFA